MKEMFMARRAKKTNGPLRYVNYYRCSSDDNKFQDYSTIESQSDKDTAYVRQKGGIVVAEFKDEGKTGTNLDRKGWKDLLEFAQNGECDRVCITYMSRLARGKDYYIAEYLLRQAGVEVETVEENFADDMAGQIQKEMTILVDGIFPKQIAAFTKTKMEAMVNRGYFCGGQPALGYTTAVAADAGDFVSAEKEPPKKLTPHPDEAEYVKQAFLMKKARCTIASIRDYLKLVTDREWDTTKTTYLLRNEIYLGIYQFGSWRNECAHSPIVERALWDDVQTILNDEEPSRPARSDRADDFVYYLRQKVRCPHCGCPYTQYSVKGESTRVHYYACLKNMKRQTDCPVKRVNADVLHYTVLTLIERAARHHTIMHQMIARSEGWSQATQAQKDQRGVLAKRRAGITTSINNIINVLQEGKGQKSLLERLATLEQDALEVTSALNKADLELEAATVDRPTAAQVQASWGAVLDIWTELTEDERVEILGALVEDVEVITKDRVILRLAPFAELHGHKLAINSHLGAGVRLELTTFGL
jgi:site-specific DNA recombinase